ncbi:MAG: sulfotransferase [Nitrospirota bacterium]
MKAESTGGKPKWVRLTRQASRRLPGPCFESWDTTLNNPAARLESDRSVWPIIIGGCYRSGTSLLRRMLDSHSRIYCGPEVKFFKDFYGDYLRDPLSHVRFFKTVRDLGIEDAVLLRLFGTPWVEAHRIAAHQQGKSRWADKNPENVLYLTQWDVLLEGRFLFVHCVRDPLDTLASIQEARFPLAIPEDFDGRVAVYRTFVKAGLEFEARAPGRSVRVRYEELVEEPRQCLSRLMDGLGEKFEEGMLSFNANRHQKGLEDPKVASTTEVHRRSLGRGRRDLTKEQIRVVVTQCANLFAQLDYS